jgi:hypothetical protein
MADNKYSAEIRDAFRALDQSKLVLQKIARERGVDNADYKFFLKQVQNAQARYDKLKGLERELKQEEKRTKAKKDLQPKLDLALATGDKAEADKIINEMKKAGIVPVGLDGKPMPGFETRERKPGMTGGKANDTDGDGIPDSIDKDPNTPIKPKTEETPALDSGTGSTGSKGVGGSTGGKGGKGEDKKAVPTDEEQRAEALDVAAGQDFALPETIFNNVPSLKALLNRYVKEDWTPEKLRKAIRDDNWYRKNSAEIKARYVQLYNYRDLVATGQADGSTDYEKQVSTLERKLADKARKIGSGLASDPEALRRAAENMYITNVGIDDAMTNDFIAAAIRPITSTIAGVKTEGYSGEALKDYQAIQNIARSNGFKISDVLPGGQNEQMVLQGLAKGTIDADRLAQDARKLAAQGQPQYVRDLLGQGYNLDQIYSPYKNTMASILEINPDQIDLNDQTLRMAISDKGDMNIYDFKKALKQDKRWQYTEQAREEVSNAALNVLRDFGFQG